MRMFLRLQYTNLEKAEIRKCLTRVRNRMPEEQVGDSRCFRSKPVIPIFYRVT